MCIIGYIERKYSYEIQNYKYHMVESSDTPFRELPLYVRNLFSNFEVYKHILGKHHYNI